MKLNLIINCAFCIVNCALLISCASNRPVATTHVERFEERVMPIPVGADTIEIVLSHTDDLSHTECTDNTEHAVAMPAEDRYKLDADTTCRVPTIESVRSTRGVNISRHETDTTSTLRITLRPDTVFVPYTHHIRSDTIVVPDRICKTKLQKTQTANVLLILILIIVIIFFLKNKITR